MEGGTRNMEERSWIGRNVKRNRIREAIRRNIELKNKRNELRDDIK